MSDGRRDEYFRLGYKWRIPIAYNKLLAVPSLSFIVINMLSETVLLDQKYSFLSFFLSFFLREQSMNSFSFFLSFSL